MKVAFKPINIPSQPKTPPPIFIKDFLGVDFATDPTVVDNRRSPDMLNMIPDTSGILNKRTGYSKVYATALGTNKPIRGIFSYRKTDGTYEHIEAVDNKLYKWVIAGTTPTSLYASMADANVSTFEMNGKLYLQDGTNYLEYNGTTVAAPTPFIPTLFTGMVPSSGSGTLYQSFNLLGAGFKNSFSSTVGDTVYKLSLAALDATTVTITVNGVAKTEGTHFTVDRTAGTINFGAGTSPMGAVGSLGTDNVIVTAYKTYSGYADRIKKCTFNALFEGRVIVSGNPDYFNSDWHSDLYEPTYFPLSGNSKVGKDSDKITGYLNQYNYLIIFKEDSTFKRKYQLDSTLGSIFVDTPLNPKIGCIAPKSIAMINNNPVVLSRQGVYMLQAGDIEDERNYIHLSQRIDPRLLLEASYNLAVGVDYGNKYHLAVNGNVYVFDYQNMSEPDGNNEYAKLGEWYFWNNIYASHFYVYDNRLYFGSSTAGLIYKVKIESDTNAYSDDGTAIECYWYGKQFSMDSYALKKNVDKMFVTLQPDNRTSCKIYYISDSAISDLIDTITQNLFNYLVFNYITFNYVTNRFPTSKRSKVKAKKIIYFQPILKNNTLNESMGIQALEIHYNYVSEVK
jgi:hypothetical protein